MIKRIASLSLIALFAALLAFFASLFANKVRAQLYPLKSFQVWYTDSLSDNSSSDGYFARRSNGDTVTAGINNGFKEYKLASKGVLIATSNRTNNIMTTGSGISYVPKDNDSACSAYSDKVAGETKSILGFNTLHVSYSRRTTVAGSVSEETENLWIAPALNCFPLVEGHHWYTDGKETAFQIEKVTSASPGEPPDEQFVLPKNGVESPPSIFWPSIGQSSFPQQETAYNNDKAKRAAASLW